MLLNCGCGRLNTKGTNCLGTVEGMMKWFSADWTYLRQITSGNLNSHMPQLGTYIKYVWITVQLSSFWTVLNGEEEQVLNTIRDGSREKGLWIRLNRDGA